METFNWDDVLDDIAEQHAVLLLGHHFLPGAQEQLHTALTEKLGNTLQHFYSRDGLFLFRDNDTKTTAQQVTARFYRNNAPDDAILKKIAAMWRESSLRNDEAIK